MKSNFNFKKCLIAACLLTVNYATAQWSRNSGTGQTFLTTSSDSVGIGTSNPLYKVDVRATGVATMQFKSVTNNASILLDRGSASSTSSLTYRTSGVNNWQTGIIANANYTIRNNSLGTPAITILSANNNVGIGTANPTEKLNVDGNILATGNINATNFTATGALNAASYTATGNVNAVNFIGTGNIDVSGYIGFGSVEQFTDGGSNTIACNSNLVPTVDCSANLGTSVKRWNNLLLCGNIGIGTTVPVSKLQITGGTDANLTTGGYIITGTITGTSVSIDDNEIIARNNSAVSTLSLNNDGGNVVINGAATASARLGMGTATPLTTIHLLHASGSGADQGLRIQNSGTNNHSFTFYTQNTLNRLDLNYNGSATAIGTFDGISGVYTAQSDMKFKKNIVQAGAVLPDLEKLQLVKYNFKTQNDGDRKYMGMIAQEVKKLFPEIVYENNTDAGETFYTMDYSAFGLIAIKAIQEQQQQINDLKQIVKQLDHSLAACCMSYGEKSDGGIVTDIARLEQNAPNPFSEKTVVKYYIPQNFKSATVKIYSMTGEEMKSFNISAAGLGQVIISGNTLASGVYQYTLLVDGKTLDSKQMILTRQ